MNPAIREAVLWRPTLHDGISLNFQTGQHYVKRIGGVVSRGALTDFFTFTGGNQSMYMGPAGLLVPSVTNTPRIEYDASGNCLGLLIEASRTNLCLQSQDFATTWTTANSSISTNATTDPAGGSTADKLVENSATALHRTLQSVTITADAVYTFSVFVKASERTFVRTLLSSTDQVQFVLGNFNLATGVVSSSSAGGTGALSGATITPYGNGWYRVTISGSIGSGLTTLRVYVDLTDNGTVSYLGDGTSGAFLYGAQIEAGRFASSYIPTTTTSVARTADSCIRTLGSEFSATAGTIVLAGRTSGGQDTGLGQTIIEIDDATSNERHTITRAATSDTVRYNIFDGGVLQSSMESASLSNLATFKSAFAWALNDIAQSTNGGTVNTDTGATLPTVTQLVLGGPGGNGNSYMNGHIRQFDYYPTRLPNADLVRLSA